MADLRAGLGDDAIILATRTLDNGQVSVTGAAADEALDLAEVLSPSTERPGLEWLSALAEFHEWPFTARERIEPILENVMPANPEAVLTTLMQALFRFDDNDPPGQKPLLLSGPPGSGKTVTIAKLAAAHILVGDDVDIITLDVARAGGLDQLRALLAPLDRAPIPVAAAAELPDVMSHCQGDVVLVDSVGINPFDPAELGALSNFVARAGADLLLVLPGGQGYADSAEIARNYVALGARALVATKLDVARRFGGLLAAAEAGLAFTQVGIGPTIGDGLAALSADGLARLLLRRYRASIGEEN
ncbi:MAG: hypothetical protein ACR2RA_02420 [Geminicoccaceae bacterium]